jgi:hypothetical protein
MSEDGWREEIDLAEGGGRRGKRKSEGDSQTSRQDQDENKTAGPDLPTPRPDDQSTMHYTYHNSSEISIKIINKIKYATQGRNNQSTASYACKGG